MGTACRARKSGGSLSGFHHHRASRKRMPLRDFREEKMEIDKTKQEIQNELEQARRTFYASGRRIRHLSPSDDVRGQNAKPRKQRLKMFA